MNKREKLEKLDAMLLDKMTDLLSKDDYEAIKSLGTISTYLKNNQVLTPPKEKSTAHDRIKNALE